MKNIKLTMCVFRTEVKWKNNKKIENVTSDDKIVIDDVLNYKKKQ